MRCFSITSELLNQTSVLTALNTFFDWIDQGHVSFDIVPGDIRADAKWLERKWIQGDYDLADPLRGLHVANKGRSRRINKEWQHYMFGWFQFGHNSLTIGEVWPYQIAVMRDGGHGATEAGVAGVCEKGAASIILSRPENREEYADRDQGERIEYIGTAGKCGRATASTRLLLNSHRWWIQSRRNCSNSENEASHNGI